MPQGPFTLTVTPERWPLHTPFRIARETKTHLDLIRVDVSDGAVGGSGEACPTEHYGETLDGEIARIRQILPLLTTPEDWPPLHDRMPPGAARNALDCALWDFQAKKTRRPVWQLLDLPQPHPLQTVYTLCLDSPEAMAAAAKAATHSPTLKLKLGAPGDADRLRAVRDAVPRKNLIADVNEGWSNAQLLSLLPIAREVGLLLLEQPLPAGHDAPLASIEHLVPIGADESCRTLRDLDHCAPLYEVVNIKLDKTGGLREALALARQARERSLDLMVGCMLGTSLAMAPAMLVAQSARFVDLDGPLLIGNDRSHPLSYSRGRISLPQPELWG